MLVPIAKAITRRILPGGRHFRTLPFGPAAGCTIKLNFHYDMRLYLGLYEVETQKWFKKLVRPGFQSFDIGGGSGYDALVLSSLSRRGRVVSFESDHPRAAEITETLARNSYPIEVVKAFVCDRNDAEHISLDSAAERFFIPDFIKLDIEGAEADALEGATAVMRERKPSMIVEVHGEHIERRCLTVLRAHGYDPLIVDRQKIFAESRALDHNRWLICEGN